MSALEELFKWLKKTRGGNGIVIKAAAELAAKDEQLDKIARYLINEGIVKTDDMADNEVFFYVQKAVAALRERVEKLEYVQVIAESVNQWLIQNELGSTAHQRQLAEALQEAQ